jgi:HNH endonuclease
MARRVKSARQRVLDNARQVDRGYGTPCFVWLGEQDKYGYGRLKHEGRYVPAHWVVKGDARRDYRPPIGDDGEEMEVDHLCKQRDCVRPTHLEYVTRLVNMQRMHDDRRNDARA